MFIYVLLIFSSSLPQLYDLSKALYIGGVESQMKKEKEPVMRKCLHTMVAPELRLVYDIFFQVWKLLLDQVAHLKGWYDSSSSVSRGPNHYSCTSSSSPVCSLHKIPSESQTSQSCSSHRDCNLDPPGKAQRLTPGFHPHLLVWRVPWRVEF